MVTIHDVAKAAGVSISTVSYALSGKRSISVTTRNRIDAAITELDYRPHAAARMLAGARTNILALSAPLRQDGHLPTHMRFVSAVVAASRAHDYDVLLLATDDEVSGIRRVGSSSLVDGVVMMGVATADERLPIVRDLALPAAFIGVPGDVDDIACVDLDFAAAARDAIDRIAELGHRTIGMIGHPRTYLERQTGFIERFDQALEREAAAKGVRIVRRWAGLERGAGRTAVDELLAEAPQLTAIVFHCNEPVVEEAERRLLELGVDVPGQVSLFAAAASYDPSRLEIPLSGITLPLEDMCRRAVESVFAAVDGRPVPDVTLLAPRFEDRGSLVTAP